MLFAQPAPMGCVDWGARCDPEKGSGAAHGVFGSADKSDVPTEITERLRNDNGHRCEMHHRLSHWAALEKDRQGPSLRVLQRVCHVIRGGLCLQGCACSRGRGEAVPEGVCRNQRWTVKPRSEHLPKATPQLNWESREG